MLSLIQDFKYGDPVTCRHNVSKHDGPTTYIYQEIINYLIIAARALIGYSMNISCNNLKRYLLYLSVY